MNTNKNTLLIVMLVIILLIAIYAAFQATVVNRMLRMFLKDFNKNEITSESLTFKEKKETGSGEEQEEEEEEDEAGENAGASGENNKTNEEGTDTLKKDEESNSSKPKKEKLIRVKASLSYKDITNEMIVKLLTDNDKPMRTSEMAAKLNADYGGLNSRLIHIYKKSGILKKFSVPDANNSYGKPTTFHCLPEWFENDTLKEEYSQKAIV